MTEVNMAVNGYFQLVKIPGGFGIKCIPPQDGGEPVQMSELTDYLGSRNIDYDISQLKKASEADSAQVVRLSAGSCPTEQESYHLEISEDTMTATVRFYPPSETGQRMSMDEFMKDMQFKKIVYGINMELLREHFSKGLYCTSLVIAEGKPPRHGKDAEIEYFFNTDPRAVPTLNEDGSVDFFNLNTIIHCRKGDVLAHIIPEDVGECGYNIAGAQIKPRNVKRATLRYGKNVALSEDHMSISSEVDGCVSLVDGQVFVSDLYVVENVDNSTGNIEFDGSVQVNGNVCSGFSISAQGNVIVKGVVEGAAIYADGDIVITRGMNGMSKGRLEAGGNIISKFLENAVANASGYISAESILHSKVTAGSEINVTGRRGFITGGHACAGYKISAKNLGANLGASTVVEVGVNPRMKEEYQALQDELLEIQKVIKKTQPILTSFAEKRAKGAQFSQEQVKYIRSLVVLTETKKRELEEKNKKWEALHAAFEGQNDAYVEVIGEAFPGTVIMIREVSMSLRSSYQHCRFKRIGGEVKMVGL